MLHADESLHVCVTLPITEMDIWITLLISDFLKNLTLPKTIKADPTIWSTSLKTVVSGTGKIVPVLK
jgi:hypothetical protein